MFNSEFVEEKCVCIIFTERFHSQEYMNPGLMWNDVLTNQEINLAVSYKRYFKFMYGVSRVLWLFSHKKKYD